MKNRVMMGVFVVLLVVATTFAILTFSMQESQHQVMRFLIHNHVGLMLVLTFIAIGFGYTWAMGLEGELKKERKDIEQLLSVLTDLLNQDEQLVIRMLVEKGGKISQSDLSRHESMTRVKAHRTVKALEERGVIHTEKHGKQVQLYLDAPILAKLRAQ